MGSTDSIASHPGYYSIIFLLQQQGRQHYRLYTIHRFPSLKSLDFARIKPAERDRALRLARSAAGAALEDDVQSENSMVKSFVPGEGVDSQGGGRSFVSASFTGEQKEMIRTLLSKASSIREVEEIENAVRRGVLPRSLSDGTAVS
jgi:U2 small nuclear ribonucleoprotein A'